MTLQERVKWSVPVVWQGRVERSYPVIPGALLAEIFSIHTALTLYRGVWVAWDGDYDTRIMDWIDSLPEWERSRLILASEHEGVINTVWTVSCPTADTASKPCLDVYSNGSGYDGWYHETVRILDEELLDDEEAMP